VVDKSLNKEIYEFSHTGVSFKVLDYCELSSGTLNTGITTTAVEMAMVLLIRFLSHGLVRFCAIKAGGT
jgi:hypothetical protein